MKKLISLILCIILCLALVTAFSFADNNLANLQISSRYRIDAAYSIYPFQSAEGVDPSNIPNASGEVNGTTITVTSSTNIVNVLPGSSSSSSSVSEEMKLYIQGPLPYAISLVEEDAANSGDYDAFNTELMIPKVDYEVDGGLPTAGNSHTIKLLSDKLLQLDPAKWAVVLLYCDTQNGTSTAVYVVQNFTLESETSIELVAIDEVKANSFIYTVVLSADSSLSDQQYGIGVEVCNNSQFTTGPGSFCYTVQNTDRSGSCVNMTLQLETCFYDLVPGVTYYVRAVLVDTETHNNFYSGNTIISITPTAEQAPYEDLLLNQNKSVDKEKNFGAKFTADTVGYYAVWTDYNVEWVEILCTEGWVTNAFSQPENGRNSMFATFHAAAGETVFFSGYASDNGMIKVVPAKDVIKALDVDIPFELDSMEEVSFTAPDTGYYSFKYATGSRQYEIQQLDMQTNKWFNNPTVYGGWFTKGDTVYLRPTYNQILEGKLSLIATKVIPPDKDRIEVSNAYSVTNRSITLDFTISVTADTAANGYHVGLLWGSDPELKNGTSMNTFNHYFVVRNNETLTLSNSNYVPGQSFYYRAVLLDNQWNILAMGTDIFNVELDSSLADFVQLSSGVPYPMSSVGRKDFYFEAPADGMYMITAEQVSSINIKDGGGGPIVGEGGKNSYQYGTYMKTGEKIFIGIAQNNGQNGSLIVFDGMNDHPVALLGTQRIWHQLPVLFTAPADGEYRFSVDNEAGLCIIDGNGDSKYQGLYYHTSLAKDQMLWLFSNFNPMFTVNLTIEQGVFPKSVLTFPDSLTELKEEACTGLTIEEAVFGSNIQRLGSRCFADCLDLQRVVIPVADVNIADDAFSRCSCVTFVAPAGGSVEDYAKSHFYINFEKMENSF